VRGFRIELREVEAALERHPALQAVAVAAHQDARGGKRLVGYFTTATAQRPSSGELRGFLQRSLPEHMVPSEFVALDTLPMSVHGKLDRRALPVPGEERPVLEIGFVAPRTPVEVALVAIWAEVLGKQGIGVEDDFFDLGGHSLRATQVIARVRKEFQLELPLRRIFEAPTIAGLALAVAEVRAEAVPADELDRLLAELENTSDEEARSLLDG
jgi:acyl carrier protein